MTYFAGEYDVAVIGAGHAGIEAALAAARLGCHTAVFTINMDAVGNCPCNPSMQDSRRVLFAVAHAQQGKGSGCSLAARAD